MFRTALLLGLLPTLVAAQGIVTPYRPPVPGFRPLPAPVFPQFPGFVPGGFYYPWLWSNQLPMNGPQVLVLNTTVVASSPARPSETPSIAGTEVAATLNLQLPAPAEVWLDGVKLDGPPTDNRSLPSPPMKFGTEYTFQIRARWTLSGNDYEVERTSTVAAGGSKKLLIVSGTLVK
jgi:hypothetical protein